VPEPQLDPEVRERFVEPSSEAFRRLVEVMAILRTECPWDREQTHQTLARHLLEETYETLETIDDNDLDALRDELGDLVLQVVFHSNIAFEEGAFTVADVLDGLREKLIRRHPHVFGDVEVADAAEVKSNWEQIKRTEKPTSLYQGIPRALPALARAAKLQRRASAVGFPPGWSEDAIFDGLSEEIAELRAELGPARDSARDSERVEAELGDVLFMVVALANQINVDPEEALRRMLHRAERRMGTVERMASDVGVGLESLSAEQWRGYWEQAKREHP
jgi:MazG family protein